MIIDKLENVTILDGNGDLFYARRQYFNRYQSTIPHIIHFDGLAIRHNKTLGGHRFDRPIFKCHITYQKCGVTNCVFTADFIEEGVFGFPQLIPFDIGITLDFDYDDSRGYAHAVIAKKKEESNA